MSNIKLWKCGVFQKVLRHGIVLANLWKNNLKICFQFEV